MMAPSRWRARPEERKSAFGQNNIDVGAQHAAPLDLSKSTLESGGKGSRVGLGTLDSPSTC